MRMPFNFAALVKNIIAVGLLFFISAGLFAQQGRSIQYWQQIVEKNPDDSKAWFNIGVLHESGQGTEKNKSRAKQAYDKAINLGYAPAMYNLGSIYAQQKDYVTARVWWEKAAELNLPEAQYNMGMLYEKGWGVSVNPQLSSSWYQRAAETAMKKYFQLYQKSRSEQIDKPTINEGSLSLFDYFRFIKTASAAPKLLPENQLDGKNQSPVLHLAQTDTTESSLNSTSQTPGWEWVYSQPQENFTIQLFATKDSTKTEKFIQQYALSEGARVIPAVVKGTKYYKVLWGTFAEWNDAAVEIGVFPQDLRNQRPWVRKFVSLYNEQPKADPSEDNSTVETPVVEDMDKSNTTAEISSKQPEPPVQTPEIQNSDNVDPPEPAVVDQASETPGTPLPTESEENNESDPQTTDESVMPEMGTTGSQADESVAAADVAAASSAGDESPGADDVFTVYSKKQLASTGLSAELKMQLKSGLEAIAAKDFDSGFNYLADLAQGGLPEAQYRMALLYSQGNGVQRDVVNAFELMKLAAEQGHPYAQQSLANFYNTGIGVDANAVLAAYWQQTADDNLKKLEIQ